MKSSIGTSSIWYSFMFLLSHCDSISGDDGELFTFIVHIFMQFDQISMFCNYANVALLWEQRESILFGPPQHLHSSNALYR